MMLLRFLSNGAIRRYLNDKAVLAHLVNGILLSSSNSLWEVLSDLFVLFKGLWEGRCLRRLMM